MKILFYKNLKSFSSETQVIVGNILNQKISSIKEKKNIQWKTYIYCFTFIYMFYCKQYIFYLKKTKKIDFTYYAD